MFKKILIILLIIAAAIIYFFRDSILPDKGLKEPQISLNGHDFTIELADTENERARGFSGRESLCQNCGMLFVFSRRAKPDFWMKDMKFDLDIIWIEGNKIVQIDKNVSHMKGMEERRSPQFLVDKVLEINAGESDRIKIEVEDEVEF